MFKTVRTSINSRAAVSIRCALGNGRTCRRGHLHGASHFLHYCAGINGNGVVAGSYSDYSGNEHGFLRIPS